MTLNGYLQIGLYLVVLLALAEGRGKAQADTLRRARRDVPAQKLARPQHGAAYTSVAAATLRQGDVVVVEAGAFIPSDGEVSEGIALVDESAIADESAPVIRESGGDRSAVTGGTRILLAAMTIIFLPTDR
jgi:potassium-transporting ATPase ATP-binding subunit